MFLRRNQPGKDLGQRVGAGVAVLHDGKLLMVQRRDNGLWDIPGGAVEPGEEVRAAALRELTEETGVTVSGVTLLGVFSGPALRHVYPDGNTVDWVTVLYRPDETVETVKACCRAADDAAQVAWWPLHGLPTQVSAATSAYLPVIQSVQITQGVASVQVGVNP